MYSIYVLNKFKKKLILKCYFILSISLYQTFDVGIDSNPAKNFTCALYTSKWIIKNNYCNIVNSYIYKLPYFIIKDLK